MDVGSEAFVWGIISAVSLPAGALLGIWWKPKSKINSAFMAFGAGALLFALSIELFGHVPHHAEEHGIWAFVAAATGALCGGLLFDLLNQMLNNRGAFLRSLSNTKKYVGILKLRRAKAMVKELCNVRVLQSMPPENMAHLVQRIRKRKFGKGQVIFKQNDFADEMFFIIHGKVNIIRHDSEGKTQQIATLKENDTFGELGILTEQARTADAVAASDLFVYVLDKEDFRVSAAKSPEMKRSIQSLAEQRLDELAIKDESFSNEVWKQKTIQHLSTLNMPVSDDDIRLESEAHGGAGKAAVAIWLGILIDGIPESLVIGMLAMSATGMSYAFVAGVFLANLPEAMSSAVMMQKNGMKVSKILWMWGSLTIVTGLGAYFGTVLFPANPQGGQFYLVLGIEGLAAGAMLTMIAETMLPEAFEQGGSIVGFSTLLGFLAALGVAMY